MHVPRTMCTLQMLSSLNGKEKDVTKKIYYVYSNMKIENTGALGR